MVATSGGVAERLNAPVLKTGVVFGSPWVRIPPPPFILADHGILDLLAGFVSKAADIKYRDCALHYNLLGGAFFLAFLA